MSYKYQRVRERLRQAVENGELTGKLPGERELARLYSANAKTINKALTDLATEGLLVRRVGRGTFVSQDGAASPGTGSPAPAQLFGYLAPARLMGASCRSLHDQTAQILQSRGHRLEQVQLPVESNGDLSGRNLRADRLRGYDGLVLCSIRPSDDLLASISRRHLPLIMVNNHHANIRTAAVLSDYSHGAFELCQHLIQIGHTRIGLLIDQALMPGAALADAGYQAAMRRYGLAGRSAVIASGQNDGEPAAAGLDGEELTAVVCVGTGAGLKLVQAARTRPVAPVLAVCCIPEPGEPIAAELDLTTYEIQPMQIAHWTAELLLSDAPARGQRVVVVPGRVCVRGSTTPAAQPAPLNPPQAAIL